MRMSMRRLSRVGLAAKFAGAVCLALVLLFALAGVIMLSRQSATLDGLMAASEKVLDGVVSAQLERGKVSERVSVEQTAKLLGAIAPEAIAELNLSGLLHYAKVATTDGDIVYVAFVSTDGKTLASDGDRQAVAQDGWIELAIDHEGVRLGTTIVGYNHTSLDQFVAKVRQENVRWVGALHEAKGAALRSATAGLVAIIVAIAMTLGCVTYGAFHLLVKRHLAAVAERFRDVAEGEGDLRQRIEVGSSDEIGRLATWFNMFMDKLHDIIVQVRTAADHVTAVSQQLSGAAEQLSVGAQEQATSLEETAASLEQITGTVKQNADNALQANQLAVGSRDTAGQGGQVVTSAVVSMQEITKASGKIAEIITVIDAIAFQTNLLALNAAVEAARAGDQGRGFAVVAAEVRNLAQRSGAAAKEIKGLIQDSVRKVRDGSELVNRSGQTFEEIMTSVRRVTDIIAEIAAASQEQSQGITQVNKAVTQMDHVVQQAAARTEGLASTAQMLAAQAQQLQVLVGRFKVDQRARAPGVVAAASASKAAARPTSTSMAPKATPKPVQPALVGVRGDRASSGLEDGFQEF